MKNDSMKQVGEIIREGREAAALSVRRLATAADVDSTWLSRLEHGVYLNPDPRHLHRLGKVLGIPTSELFEAAEYSEGLPNFAPYLREKYELPEDAIGQLEAHFELIANKYERKRGGQHGESHSTTA